LLSRRGRLVFVATALLLITALVAAPSVGGAKPASVKQFVASISGGDAGSLTMSITNCGGPPPLELPCTASSTIALGSVRIPVPTALQPPLGAPPPTAISPDGRIWTASFVSGNIDAHAVGGNDKLQPGEKVIITWQFDATTTCVTQTFTGLAAWGSIAISGSDPFALQPPNPTLNCVGPGGSVTDPVTGQTETIAGNFTGHVLITFGGVGPDCSSEAGFGTLGAQWEVYHLPSPVSITPAGNFHVGTPPQDKISTSEFDQDIFGGDSSWYLICFAVPQEGHTAFQTRGGGTAVPQTVGGVPSFVGILASCVDAPTPCVSEQFLTTGPGSNPSLWDPTQNRVHIAIRMEPGDPHKR
jgi:hypothetical protein